MTDDISAKLKRLQEERERLKVLIAKASIVLDSVEKQLTSIQEQKQLTDSRPTEDS